MDIIRNVVVMGSGCAGHTAALYTARANLHPLLIVGLEAGRAVEVPGGLVANVHGEGHLPGSGGAGLGQDLPPFMLSEAAVQDP